MKAFSLVEGKDDIVAHGADCKTQIKVFKLFWIVKHFIMHCANMLHPHVRMNKNNDEACVKDKDADARWYDKALFKHCANK